MSALEPAVSVLVTVYNREQYVAQSLRSILESTFQDFELIIVDDQSTDRSFEIAAAFADAERVRVFRNERNLGDYPNRMRAAGFARGRFLKYVDSDDILYPHSLGVMVEAMEKYPQAALGLSHSRPEEQEPYPWQLAPAAAWQKHFLGGGTFGCGPSGAIIRRSAFTAAGGFRDWGVLSDTELWCRLAARSPIVLLPPALVWWRRHGNQEFSRNDARVVYLERGFDLAMHALTSPDNPLSARDARDAIAKAQRNHGRRLLSLAFRDRRVASALRLWKKSQLPLRGLVSGLRGYS